MTMATFIVLTLNDLAAPLGAYCHESPVLDCAFVYTCSGTALHDPLQHCTNASQENINQFVFCDHADINRLKTTYLRYRKRLRRIFLYTSKRRFHRRACLAWLLLLLLLCGDVEVNPGPTTGKEYQTETAKELNACLAEDEDMEAKKCSRVAMLSACQRKRLDAETVKEHCARLAVMAQNQTLQLQCETKMQRAARLATLAENWRKRLKSETEEDREARLATLAESQRKQVQLESEEDCDVRLATLSEN